MFNTSITDINSTSVPFNTYICVKDIYVGMVVSYVLKSLCFCLGTPAYSWILWLFFHAGGKIKPYQVCLLNLTVLELIFCIQCAADMLNTLLFNEDTLTTAIYFLFRLSWVGKTFMSACISVEQYLAVLHPMIFLKYKAIQYRIASVAVVWLVTATYALYQVFQNTYPDVIFNVVFLASVTVISFCCVSVLCSLKHPGPGDTQITTERGRDAGNQQKRNAFNIIFSGLLVILFTYLPQVSLTLFNVIKIDEKLLFCNIVPFVSSFNILGVMIAALLRMHMDGHLKCLKQSKGN